MSVFAGVGERMPRGQRPHSRDDRVGRHRQDGLRVRPDERAARRPPARRPDRPHMAEYFRDEEGRDVLLFIDNIFRFTQAGSEVSALLGRMPSAVGYQPNLATEMGGAAGADHLHHQGLDHLAPGRVRSRGRLHGPGAGHHVRPPRLDDPPRALHRRAGHLSGGGPADVDLPRARSAISWARSTTTWRARRSASCSGTVTCRTSSRSWASTSCPKRTRSTVARARRLQRFMSQPFFVAEVFTGPLGRVRVDQGHGRVVQGDPRGQGRHPARAGVLPGGHDRGRPRERREAGRLMIAMAALASGAPPSARFQSCGLRSTASRHACVMAGAGGGVRHPVPPQEEQG